MESIIKIFRIGTGPSSSHTMGPERAAGIFKARCPDAARYRAILYGSLAATGKGHLTDIALKKIFGDQLEIVWNPETELPFHPNGLKFHAIDKTDSVTSEATFYSTGGGAISEGGEKKTDSETYSLSGLEEILNHCRAVGWRRGISPPRSHRSVRESLDSHGSSHPVDGFYTSNLALCSGSSHFWLT